MNCDLCDDTANVVMTLTRWRDSSPEYSTVPRCKAVDACRDRVLASGEWPVADGRPSRDMRPVSEGGIR